MTSPITLQMTACVPNTSDNKVKVYLVNSASIQRTRSNCFPFLPTNMQQQYFFTGEYELLNDVSPYIPPNSVLMLVLKWATKYMKPASLNQVPIVSPGLKQLYSYSNSHMDLLCNRARLYLVPSYIWPCSFDFLYF